MDYMTLIISFVILMIIFVGFSAFVLQRVFVANTDGAIERLESEYAEATQKQAELNKKLRQADDELTKRKTEARDLAEKMRSQTEEETKEERDKIIKEAREEGEQIIAKAKGATESLRKELEKEMDSKFIGYSMRIITNILSEKAKGAFDQVLVDEFLNDLQQIEPSKIPPNVKEIEIVSTAEVKEDTRTKTQAILKEKLGQDFNITTKQDKELGGGMILKFGSMTVDGSLSNLIRKEGLQLRQEVDDRV